VFLKTKKSLYKDIIREIAKGDIKIATMINGGHVGLFLLMYAYEMKVFTVYVFNYRYHSSPTLSF
jgi:hypothetical protein